MAPLSPVKSNVNQGHQNNAARALWLRVATTIHVIAFVAVMFGFWWVSQYIDKAEAMARPALSVGLVDTEGLELDHSSSPPAFHLTLDAKVRVPISGCCRRIGGGKSVLRVSYHGILLAWGHVPTFCACGGVATVVAKAEAILLRDEVRALIQSEQQVVGKAEFDVETEVAELGYVHCKAFLPQGNAMEGSRDQCQVHYCN